VGTRDGLKSKFNVYNINKGRETSCVLPSIVDQDSKATMRSNQS